MSEKTGQENHGSILIVDDEFHQRNIMQQAVLALGYEVEVVADGARALERLRFGHFDLLITDMQLPGMNGLEILASSRIHDPTVSIIMVTAHGTIESAVDAMKKGAEDYLLKPLDLNVLEMCLHRIFQKRALVRENRLLQSENANLKRDLRIRYSVPDAIGKSTPAQNLFGKIEIAMKTKLPLLILGETGAGKDEIARMIHYNSPWAYQGLIFFDCIAVPEELHETHLFGKELATQAGVKNHSRPGLIEGAHQGTLVISNIHRLSRNCQSHLSRVLRESKTQRSGGIKFYPVSIRIIGTSEKEDFEKSMSTDEMRWDVHKLLLENVLQVPPLRERREDIPLLIAATAKKTGQALDKTIDKIDKLVINHFIKYDFPGDLTELKTLVESAVIRCQGSVLKLEDFFPIIRKNATDNSTAQE